MVGMGILIFEQIPCAAGPTVDHAEPRGYAARA